MALIKCPECGKEISDTVKSCPNCGYEKGKTEQNINSTQSLNKSAIIKLIIVVAIFFIAICCYVFYQETRCNAYGCNETAISNSKYCEKHTCTNDGCYNYKEAWSTVCDTCYEIDMENLKNDDTIDKMEDELREKYGDDIFSDEMHMPTCSMSGCDDEGTGTYGGKWYCSKHLYEMKEYGDTIAN